MLLGALAVTVTLVIVQYMPTHNDTEIAKFNLIQLFIQPSVEVVKRDNKLNFRCNFGQLLFNFKLMTLTFLSEII